MKIVVVGAGVSAAHAALTLLERGHAVELWDIGREEGDFPCPGASFERLRDCLDDPVAHLLGKNLEALIPPGSGELLRYPPSRSFLARPDDPLWPFRPEGFHPQASFHRGGLANGWGANALTWDDDDLAHWPLSADDLAEDYRTVQRRIPVAAPQQDELSPHFPHQRASQPPVPLTDADRLLLRRWQRRKDRLAHLGARLAPARLAVITDPRQDRACDLCNRCLWGCPHGSLYNPAHSTLPQCERHAGFRYRPHRQVLSLEARDDRIHAIRFRDLRDGSERTEPCDQVFLAAGALASGAIFLRTLARHRPDLGAESEGLLDTRVLKVPYLLPGRIGHPAPERAFQFNRLILGLLRRRDQWPAYLHGEILHLGSLLYHPLVESLPLGTGLSSRLFFALRPALGAVSLFLPDRIRGGNRLRLMRDHPDQPVELHYHEDIGHRQLQQETLDRVRALLRRLGCLPRGAVASPPGAGIHYGGTVPMGRGPRRCNARGRSNLYSNLYLADGAAFPDLPSKSLTLTLAAHATRVARLAEL